MANDDVQTDLKKRARRRLVGAAALALAAVIVLPMIMDPEPKPVGEDIQVRIPSEVGSNATAHSIELPAPPVTEPVVPAPVESNPPVAEVSRAAPVEKPEAPAAKPKAVEVPAPKAAEPSPEKPASASNEAERVAAILSGQAASAAPVGDAGPGFVVQVGAFSNAGSASALSEKIRQAGFKSYTRQVGATTRVRVGPYGSREEAEAVAARMAGKGFKGVVMPRG